MPLPPFTSNNVRTLGELAQWQAGEREPILEPGLPIIDPHHHLREDARGRYHLCELLADVRQGHDIRGTVFIESQCNYATEGPPLLRPVAETGFVTHCLADMPDFGACVPCAGIVGMLDLAHGPTVRAGLQAHIAAANGRFRGIRDPLTWDDGDFNYGPRRPARDRMMDPQFRAGFAQLAPLGLTFDTWVFHHQLPMLGDLARSFPETTIVLDHVGMPLGVGPHENRRAEIYESWRSSMRELARCGNVVVKLGGLGMLFFGFGFYLRDKPPGSEELAQAWAPYIHTCIAAFGPDRCMFESNFPVDIQTCSYATLWNTFKRIAAGYSNSEKAALFFGTANRVYRLGLSGG